LTWTVWGAVVDGPDWLPWFNAKTGGLANAAAQGAAPWTGLDLSVPSGALESAAWLERPLEAVKKSAGDAVMAGVPPCGPGFAPPVLVEKADDPGTSTAFL
jgi:hypothetical protein